MSASGALVAVRDPEGIRCLASTGDAPAVGSRLQPDSTFTRECIETGEVVLCDDTEKDSRIQPSVAQSLHLRSAVAVPIQAQGSVVGVIEVFSSRPSAIYGTDVAVLKQFANLFAPFIVPGVVPGAHPSVRGSTLTLAPVEAASAAEEQREEGQRFAGTNRFSVERGIPLEPVTDSRKSPFKRGAPSFAPAPSSFERPAGNPSTAAGWRSEAVPPIFLRFVGKSTEARIWRSRAASLSFLAVLFFFLFFFVFFGVTPP
jgi:hypothetical protein